MVSLYNVPTTDSLLSTHVGHPVIVIVFLGNVIPSYSPDRSVISSLADTLMKISDIDSRNSSPPVLGSPTNTPMIVIPRLWAYAAASSASVRFEASPSLTSRMILLALGLPVLSRFTAL